MGYSAKYDLNKDGRIDDADVAIFQSYYFTYVDPNDPISVACDFNGDGFIDTLDSSLLMAHYGSKGDPSTGEKKGKINAFLIIGGFLAALTAVVVTGKGRR